MKKEIIPSLVLNQYAIGTIQRIFPITVGLIHQTYEVRTNKGQYIMQRLHPALSSKKIGQDFLVVTKHLNAQQIPAPMCQLTKNGEVLARDGEFVWRMQTKVSGKTVDQIKNVIMAREAAEMYARFHHAMNSLEYTFKSSLILHQTKNVLQKFLSVGKRYSKDPLMKAVKDEFDLIKRELPKHLLPDGLPLRVIHGDPKISNVLFLKKKGHAIIDLDTCQRASILVELGDAFRSWCGKQEDDPRNTFSIPLFRSAWKGYLQGSDGFLTKKEVDFVPKAVGTIILELAARFLTDYFEDTYFGWNEKKYPSRREHNLARCRGQLKEFVDYQKKLPQIKKFMR